MQYLTQNKIKSYRSETRPDYCAISGATMTSPALDHDHETGMVRGVIDREANAWLGRVENAYKRISHDARQRTLPEMLRAAADYLEQEQTDVLHPVGAKDLAKRFKASNLSEQLAVLQELILLKKINQDDVCACKNSTERTSLYLSAIKSNKWQKQH